MSGDHLYTITYTTGTVKIESGSRVTSEGLIEYWGRRDLYDDNGRLVERGPVRVNFVVDPRPAPLEWQDWAAIAGGVLLHVGALAAVILIGWMIAT